MGHESRQTERFRETRTITPPSSATPVQVTGYIDCGADENGQQSIIFFPTCRRIDVAADADGNEIVTLTVEDLKEWKLGVAQSREFLYKTHMRERPQGLITIPDVARRRFGQ